MKRGNVDDTFSDIGNRSIFKPVKCCLCQNLIKYKKAFHKCHGCSRCFHSNCIQSFSLSHDSQGLCFVCQNQGFLESRQFSCNSAAERPGPYIVTNSRYTSKVEACEISRFFDPESAEGKVMGCNTFFNLREIQLSREDNFFLYSFATPLIHKELHLDGQGKEGKTIKVFAYLGLGYLCSPLYVQELPKSLSSELESLLSSVEPGLFPNVLDMLFTEPSKDDPEAAQPIGLAVNLLAFQKRTLHWMLHRESCFPEIPDLKMKGLPYHYNPISQKIFTRGSDAFTFSHGGLLSEEMGLGKTVEVISLILSHPAPQSWVSSFSAGAATSSATVSATVSAGAATSSATFSADTLNAVYDKGSSLPRCKTTLIIAPDSILLQWMDELEEKCPSLKCSYYVGYDKKSSGFPFKADTFNDFDVVLTTFDVLKKDFYFTVSCDRQLRGEKRYVYEKSPLIQTCFWRLVVDEAQFIEKTHSIVSETANCIHSRNRWVVTGTPYSASENDLKGLVDFLGIDPFATCWNRLMKQLSKEPSSKSWYCLESIMRPYFRRTTKAGLGDELVLPAQIHENIVVEFNEMERYIYENYQRKLQEEGFSSSDEIRRRYHLESSLMLCSTPFYEKTVERQHNFQQTSAIIKVQGSVRQVLEKLFRTAISEYASLDRESCEIQIRQGVVLELQKRFEEALVIYQKLGSYSEGKSESPLESPIDKDQMEEDMQEMINDQIRYWRQIHHKAVFNRASIMLELKRKSEADVLFEKCEKIRQIDLAAAEEQVEICLKAVKDIRPEIWKSLVLDKAPMEGGVLTESIIEDYEEMRVLVNKLSNFGVLVTKYLIKILNRKLLENYEQDAVIQDQGLQAQNLFNVIYQIVNQMATSQVNVRVDFTKKYIKGTVAPDLEEMKLAKTENIPYLPEPPKTLTPITVLEESMMMLKQRIALPGQETAIVKESLSHFHDMSDRMKKALKEIDRFRQGLTKVWNARIVYYRQLQKFSDNVALPEIPDLERELGLLEKESKIVAEKLEMAQSRQRYLTNLIKENFSDSTESYIKTCIICRSDLEDTFILTSCGHYGCQICMETWIKAHRKCPVCMKGLLYSVGGDCSLVVSGSQQASSSKTSINDNDGLSREKIKGKFSSKISLLCRHLQHLHRLDKNQKFLIFSQFDSVLDYICEALDSNDIRYVRFKGKNRRESVRRFHFDPSTRVFLLHSKTQASGLTLVNASHVFLVEPILDEAVESQAIGRVHRIGQVRETHVYHYYVKNSVEEKLLNQKK